MRHCKERLEPVGTERLGQGTGTRKQAERPPLPRGHLPSTSWEPRWADGSGAGDTRL